MTDQDTMVYIRNAALALGRIAQEKGIAIGVSVNADGEGFINARAGEYEYTKIRGSKEEYEYRPIGEEAKKCIKKWKCVQPAQIRFGQKPIENAPQPTKAMRDIEN